MCARRINIPLRAHIMKVYKLLLAFEKIGLLKPMCHVGLLPSHLMKWMDIYAFSLEHPDMSYVEVSNNFNGATKSTIGRALSFMNQEIKWSSRNYGTQISKKSRTFAPSFDHVR